MAAPVIQFKRGLLANLPGLQAGEPAFTTDSYDLFVGLTSETNTNKFFGSHRYWTKETTSTGSGINLVEGTSSGSDYITLKSPDSLAGIVTYFLPGVQGAESSVLTNDGSGNLTWSSGSLNAVFSGITTIGGEFFDVNVDSDFAGITTFSNTTDNTLGDPNTGAVQIDGGLGVDKNVTIGAGLSVSGESYFIGTATFYGGTLNLGDSDTDNINVAGEFVSNLIPNTDDTYDIGDNGTPKRWRNAAFSGVGTFASGAVLDSVQVGINTAVIETTSGKLTLTSATGVVEVTDRLDVIGDLDVSGNVFIGGTTITLRGEDVFIENKDIVLGYTTSVTPNDTTANHAGVAIASTEGTPLVPFAASGINTLPDTYKQLMWFRSGTLGFATDAFAFNYGVAIGTTTMADGVRLAVTNTEITDTTINTPQVNVSGASTIGGLLDAAGGLKVTGQTVLNNDLAVTGVSTFTGAVDTNGGLDVNGHTELDNLHVSGISTFTGPVDSNGGLSISGGLDVTGQTVLNNDLSVTGVSTLTGFVDANGGLDVTGQTVLNNDLAVTGVSTLTGFVDANGGLDVTGQVAFNNDLIVTGVSTFTGAIDANGGLDVSGGETILSSATVSDLTEGRVVLAGASGSLVDSTNLTFGSGGLTVGTGGINVTGVSTFSSNLIVGGDVRINGNDIQASDGNANITLTSNTLTTFAGDIKVTGNDIQSSTGTALTLSGSDVTVIGDLTVGGSDIKAADGTTALTLANSTGAVTAANDLTVNGNLYVAGNTTQVNTAALTVEDRTIDLGVVNGALPSSATTWDLGVLFNYHTGGFARKSAVIWEHGHSRFKFASVLGADADGINNDGPQLTVTTFAPIEIGSLWVTDCAGTSQVISCTGTERFLENITIDAGTF
jgi:hypothetical protein